MALLQNTLEIVLAVVCGKSTMKYVLKVATAGIMAFKLMIGTHIFAQLHSICILNTVVLRQLPCAASAAQ